MVKFFITFFTVLLLLFPQAAFAGGGPVSLSAFPLRPFDQTKTFILQAEVYTNQCDQVKPNFTFKDPVDGDSITPFTPPDDGTYITRHYFVTNYPTITWKEICTTYVQAKSGVAKQRTAIATVNVNGKTETREIPVSFGDDIYSKQIQTFGRVNDYDNTPQPDVLGEKYLGGPKREVNLHWQKIPWAAKYAVFAKQILSNGTIDQTPLAPLAVTENTQAIIILAAFSDFYINAIACKTDDPCSTNKQGGYSFLLPRMHVSTPNGGLPPEEAKVTPFITPHEIPADTMNMIKQPLNQEKQVEELNQKVSSLEGKLAESQKKQSILQQRLSDLITFIKRLFPFFK